MTAGSADDRAGGWAKQVPEPWHGRRTGQGPSAEASSGPELSTLADQVAGSPAGDAAVAPAAVPHVRNSAMLLLNEDLARARMRQMERDAERLRLAYRMAAVRRRRRRAGQVAWRVRIRRTDV